MHVHRVYVERTDENNIRLYITKITEDDAGLYTCNAELPAEVAATDTPSSTPSVLRSEVVKLFLYGEPQTN